MASSRHHADGHTASCILQSAAPGVTSLPKSPPFACRLTGYAVLPSSLTRSAVRGLESEASWDGKAAEQALGWEPTPWEEVVRAIEAQAQQTKAGKGALGKARAGGAAAVAAAGKGSQAKKQD